MVRSSTSRPCKRRFRYCHVLRRLKRLLAAAGRGLGCGVRRFAPRWLPAGLLWPDGLPDGGKACCRRPSGERRRHEADEFNDVIDGRSISLSALTQCAHADRSPTDGDSRPGVFGQACRYGPTDSLSDEGSQIPQVEKPKQVVVSMESFATARSTSVLGCPLSHVACAAIARTITTPISHTSAKESRWNTRRGWILADNLHFRRDASAAACGLVDGVSQLHDELRMQGCSSGKGIWRTTQAQGFFRRRQPRRLRRCAGSVWGWVVMRRLMRKSSTEPTDTPSFTPQLNARTLPYDRRLEAKGFDSEAVRAAPEITSRTRSFSELGHW